MVVDSSKRIPGGSRTRFSALIASKSMVRGGWSLQARSAYVGGAVGRCTSSTNPNSARRLARKPTNRREYRAVPRHALPCLACTCSRLYSRGGLRLRVWVMRVRSVGHVAETCVMQWSTDWTHVASEWNARQPAPSAADSAFGGAALRVSPTCPRRPCSSLRVCPGAPQLGRPLLP